MKYNGSNEDLKIGDRISVSGQNARVTYIPGVGGNKTQDGMPCECWEYRLDDGLVMGIPFLGDYISENQGITFIESDPNFEFSPEGPPIDAECMLLGVPTLAGFVEDVKKLGANLYLIRENGKSGTTAGFTGALKLAKHTTKVEMFGNEDEVIIMYAEEIGPTFESRQEFRDFLNKVPGLNVKLSQG